MMISSSNASERTRQAARDGYLEILRNLTRKECNSPDDDGMTATHWAAYSGNLNALRVIVGRGGDPEKCDNFGNTALHWCANNGHFKCVSFLISFGVNLWAMDNQYHTAKEIAALNNHEKIVQLIDDVVAQQSALNTKAVQKLKEKAKIEVEKRIKNFRKLQNKTTKQAEKEAKQREKILKKSFCLLNTSTHQDINDNELNIYDTFENKSLSQHQSIVPNNGSTVPKFSDLVNSTIKAPSNKMKILSGVSRKVLTLKHNSTDTIKSSDRAFINGTCRSVQSMVGIRRDDQIVYVPKFNSLSVNDLVAKTRDKDVPSKNGNRECNNNRLPLKDVFNCEQRVANKTNTFNKSIKTTLKSKLLKLNKLNINNKSNLYRAVSEPDFLQADRENENTINNNSTVNIMNKASSIFERPGFGSVTFRGKFTPELMFSASRYYQTDNSTDDSEDDFDSGHDHSHGNSESSNNTSNNGKYSMKNLLETPLSPDGDSYASDSIGSAGSLAQQDYLEDITQEDHFDNRNDNESKSVSVLLFLYAHGLKDYYDVFETEQIDIESLMLLGENDLITLGIPLGPRRKLLNAIQHRKKIIENNEQVFETRL